MGYTFKQYTRDIWQGLRSGDPLTWIYYVGCCGGLVAILVYRIVTGE